MALRVELKAKLLISNDNNATPQDIAFNSGDKTKIDAATFAEATSKVLKVDPLAVNVAVNLDNITSVVALFVMTDDTGVSVTLVPTGASLGDCTAIPLAPGYPMVLGSDLEGVYLSNEDDEASATVRIGAVGN